MEESPEQGEATRACQSQPGKQEHSREQAGGSHPTDGHHQMHKEKTRSPLYKDQKPAVRKGISKPRGHRASWALVSGLEIPTACLVSFQLTH